MGLEDYRIDMDSLLYDYDVLGMGTEQVPYFSPPETGAGGLGIRRPSRRPASSRLVPDMSVSVSPLSANSQALCQLSYKARSRRGGIRTRSHLIHLRPKVAGITTPTA